MLDPRKWYIRVYGASGLCLDAVHAESEGEAAEILGFLQEKPLVAAIQLTWSTAPFDTYKGWTLSETVIETYERLSGEWAVTNSCNLWLGCPGSPGMSLEERIAKFRANCDRKDAEHAALRARAKSTPRT
jgi:hypothetical protein